MGTGIHFPCRLYRKTNFQRFVAGYIAMTLAVKTIIDWCIWWWLGLFTQHWFVAFSSCMGIGCKIIRACNHIFSIFYTALMLKNPLVGYVAGLAIIDTWHCTFYISVWYVFGYVGLEWTLNWLYTQLCWSFSCLMHVPKHIVDPQKIQFREIVFNLNPALLVKGSWELEWMVEHKYTVQYFSTVHNSYH